MTCTEPYPDSDVGALEESYVTITPLQFNLTHRSLLEQMRTWPWQI
jgi:5'-nucleotidase